MLACNAILAFGSAEIVKILYFSYSGYFFVHRLFIKKKITYSVVLIFWFTILLSIEGLAEERSSVLTLYRRLFPIFLGATILI